MHLPNISKPKVDFSKVLHMVGFHRELKKLFESEYNQFFSSYNPIREDDHFGFEFLRSHLDDLFKVKAYKEFYQDNKLLFMTEGVDYWRKATENYERKLHGDKIDFGYDF